MRAVLGIDAAWTAHHPSGVALVKETSAGWQCMALAPSYESFIAIAQGTPVDWTARRFAGCQPDLNTLVTSAVDLLHGAPVSVITVDMPVATVPVTARRVCDSLVSRAFGAKLCAVHSPNPERPGPIAARMRDQAEELGYPVATASSTPGATPALVEVYPHPAIVALLDLPMRLEYKAGNAGKFWPGSTPLERKGRLLANFGRLLEGLRNVISGIELELPAADEVRSTAGLKRLEDALDALVCAWVGICYLEGRVRAFGDETAVIWIPDLS